MYLLFLQFYLNEGFKKYISLLYKILYFGDTSDQAVRFKKSHFRNLVCNSKLISDDRRSFHVCTLVKWELTLVVYYRSISICLARHSDASLILYQAIGADLIFRPLAFCTDPSFVNNSKVCGCTDRISGSAASARHASGTSKGAVKPLGFIYFCA